MASPVYPTPRDHTHFYEPSPRWYHYTVPIGGNLYTWGGRTQDFSEHNVRQLQSVVETFDPYLEVWVQTPTRGFPPPGMCSGGCTTIEDSMYVCCGNDGNNWQSALHQFDSTSLQWRKLLERNPSEGPMRKHGCQMVSYQGDKLALFGGYGTPTGPIQPGSRFIKDIRFTDGRGWSNEFHLFHLKEGIWSSPPTTGDRPPPCSNFSFTAIDSHRAVLFGGRQEHGKTNDAYILDLQKMHWKKLYKSGDWPVGRSSHAACCINYGEQHPQLLVTGGVDKDDKTLSDAWLLDVDSGTWKELNLPDGRCFHTIAAISLGPGLTEATVIGGCSKWIPHATDDEQSKHSIADTTVLQFESIEVPSTGGGRPSREWVLVGVADKRQLGSPDRLREKMDKVQQRATATEKEMTTTDRATLAEGRMRLAEILGQMTERVAQATDRRAEEAEKEVETMKQALQESQAREREAREETEKSLQEANMRVWESERGMLEATRQREEAKRNTSMVRARAERAETQANKAEHTIQTQNDQISRQTQQIGTLAHQLESQGAQSGQLKQRLDTTEKRLHSKEVEMRKQQHQMEMKELEVLSLQYYLKGREEQVQRQQEEMREQQTATREIIVQLQHLEERIRKQKEIGTSPQATEIAHQASLLQHRAAAGVQEVETQQTHLVVESSDFGQASESLRRIEAEAAEREAAFVYLRQENATLQQQLIGRQQMLQTKEAEVVLLQSNMKDKDDDILQLRQTQEEQIRTQELKFSEQEQQFQSENQELQSRVESLEKSLTKEEFLESVYSQQVDQLRDDVMEREEEIYRLKTQQTKLTKKATGAMDSTRPFFGYLRGAEVVAQRSFPLTLQARSFEWMEYGFMLHVPEGSLPPEMTQTTVDVRVSLSGQFEFPEDSDLVSATYWLSCPHKFMKPLDVEFQHCAAITDPSHCSQLSFVITKCTQKELPYKFKELEGGTFSQYSSYGRISLTHFSGLAIILKRLGRGRVQPTPVPTTQVIHVKPATDDHASSQIQAGQTASGDQLLEVPLHNGKGGPGVQPAPVPTTQVIHVKPATDDHASSQIQAGQTASGDQLLEVPLHNGNGGPGVQYCAQLFTNKRVNDWKIQLMVTKNLKACCSVTEREYSAVVAQALHTSRFILQFAEDAISPDIPRGGTVLPNGWEIILPYDPTIERHEVDRYSPKWSLRVPGCEFALRWSLEGKPPVYLKHPIPLNGAKGDKYFTLYIPDPGAVSAVESSESELSSPSGSVSSPHAPQTGLSSQYRALQSEPELSDLQNEIATKIPNMWYAVGIQLKLTHNDLCSWLAESPSDTKKLFGHVFTAWKDRGTREYRWATMIEVLKTPSVCQPRLAEELAKKLNH